ncbi:hypothetical protein [Demequina gelatinilytica]|uniref:hypothetical protein n=1 Tax=Demequina gelatinilytica TaxID=1638980 RepID=UPI0007819E0E|nr:hypothetical protein [Demequina gelatinilytica]
MGFDYDVDPQGLATFVAKARTLAGDLASASPRGDSSLASLADGASGFSDKTIGGLVSAILEEHEDDLAAAVTSVTAAIDAVERAGQVVTAADQSAGATFQTAQTGLFDPTRFSAK